MKTKLRLPLSVLSILDESESFKSRINGSTRIQSARSQVLDEIIKRFIGKYEVFNIISTKKESVVVRTDYLDYLYANKGWGEHSLDVWIGMIVELELGTKKDNPLPPDSHRTSEIYSISPYLFKNLKSKEEKEKLIIDSVTYLLKTTSAYYTKENTRTITYETNDSFFFYIRDLKGYGVKMIDRLVEWSVNHYIKENNPKTFENFL